LLHQVNGVILLYVILMQEEDSLEETQRYKISILEEGTYFTIYFPKLLKNSKKYSAAFFVCLTFIK
jgi:hypothetical protein